MTEVGSFLFTTLEVLAALFIVVIGLAVATVIVLYIIDKTQTKHTIRRNYPVVERARYFLDQPEPPS